jgi:hypothetical protein
MNMQMLAAQLTEIGLVYSSILTDVEWALVEPRIPPARHGGQACLSDEQELPLSIMTPRGCERGHSASCFQREDRRRR